MASHLSPQWATTIDRPRYDVSLLYLEEALQAFRADCILSATVMLGVATEHAFLLLIEAIDKNPKHRTISSLIRKECGILRKINKFCKVLEQERIGLPEEIREDLDICLSAILTIMHNFRNESDYPSDKIIDRKQSYILLQLFPDCCKKMEQLLQHYG